MRIRGQALRSNVDMTQGRPLNVIFSFALPLLIYFLTRMGLVSAGFLRKSRRQAFLILLVVAAIITPPDIFSLILVILPLYGLYELSIKLAERTERKHAAEEEQTTETTE